MNKRVLVIILSYNRLNWLEETIQSFLRQTYWDFRLVVLDNASDQDIEGLTNKINDPRVSLIRHATNVGGLENFRLACEMADGDYTIIFHDDDYAHPNLLEWQVRALDEQPDALLALANCNMVSDQSKMAEFDPALDSDYEVFADGDDLFAESINRKGMIIGFGGVVYRSRVLKESLDLIKDCCERFNLCVDRGLIFTLAQCRPCVYMNTPTYNVRSHDEQDSQRLFDQYKYVLDLMRYQRESFGERWDSITRENFETSAAGYLMSALLWHARSKPACLPVLAKDIITSGIMPAGRLMAISAMLAARGVINRTLRGLRRIPLGRLCNPERSGTN